MVSFELGKRDFVWIGLIVILLGVGFGYAFGGGDPEVMGHSFGEVGLPEDCVVGEVLEWSGDDWVCGEDSTSATICSGAGKVLNGDGGCVDNFDGYSADTRCSVSGVISNSGRRTITVSCPDGAQTFSL